MFCPQCRHIWTVETNGKPVAKRVTVKGRLCPTCGVLLTRDRMASEFPLDEFACRGAGAITVSEVLRQSMDSSHPQVSKRSSGSPPLLAALDDNRFMARRGQLGVPAKWLVDRISVVIIVVGLVLYAAFFVIQARSRYLDIHRAHVSAHTVAHRAATISVTSEALSPSTRQ